jgi:hypothetical protein
MRQFHFEIDSNAKSLKADHDKQFCAPCFHIAAHTGFHPVSETADGLHLCPELY